MSPARIQDKMCVPGQRVLYITSVKGIISGAVRLDVPDPIKN